VVRDPPHRLRDGVLHRRGDARLLANSLETAALGLDGFTDVGTGPGSTEGNYID